MAEMPSSLKRPLQPMPEDVRKALARRHLRSAYEARPAYQRNDYLGWIARAVRPDMRKRRLTRCSTSSTAAMST
jgi:hypothetical protein